MWHLLRATVGSLVLAFGLQSPTSVETTSPPKATLSHRHDSMLRRLPEDMRAGARPFVRTELFFGTARASGPVTEAEFQQFVALEVRPRFPDGLTLLEARGQFRQNDVTVEEQSFVLILLYPYETSSTCARRIQRIRDLYKQQFDQESVLRVDNPDIVWVSF